ncbi:MAG: MFS transporter [Planctomycetota bacterium]
MANRSASEAETTVQQGGGTTPEPAGKVAAHSPETSPDRNANFVLVAFYQVLLRVGWIFKTESIIMPAVVDLMGGGGLLRGFLPMFNRFGQSIPPLLASSNIRSQRVKKISLCFTSALMGACFLFLSYVWSIPGMVGSPLLPVIFIATYAVFFSSVGVNQLVFGTLTGKLIPVRRRGLLVLISTTVGSACAISCAWFILRRWIATEDGNFTWIFGFTGSVFLVAAIVALFFREPAVAPVSDRKDRASELFSRAWKALKEDANFRLLAIASAMFGMSMTLFPHYQSLARENLDLTLKALVPWVIAQNIGAALFSIPAGTLADRLGNKVVLRFVLITLCFAPILAMLLTWFGTPGQNSFWIVFVLLGLTPVTMRTFNNYALEITDADNHPLYLSTLGLCMAGPAILTSILFGWSVDLFGYAPLFIFVTGLIFTGWWLAGKLEEPRN